MMMTGVPPGGNGVISWRRKTRPSSSHWKQVMLIDDDGYHLVVIDNDDDGFDGGEYLVVVDNDDDDGYVRVANKFGKFDDIFADEKFELQDQLKLDCKVMSRSDDRRKHRFRQFRIANAQDPETVVRFT